MVTPATNPFRMSKIESIPFQFYGESEDLLWRKLEQNDWRGAIIGPHGSGKTTLLEHVQRVFESRGKCCEIWTFHRVSRRWHDRVTCKIQRSNCSKTQTILLVDGVDIMPWIKKAYLKAMMSRYGGVIVTAHKACILPTVKICKVDSVLADALIAQLSLQVDCDSQQLLEHCGGNMRQVFRELYDRAFAEY